MDRLSPLAAVFLDAEDADPHVSMAIGSIAVLAGAPPRQDEFAAALCARLRAVRRARQGVRRVPLDVGPPVWEDLGGFDPDRPLWESWVTEGLAGGRWAVLTKVHHCLADGIAGTHLLEAMFATVPPGAPDWTPEPPPGAGALVRDAVAKIAGNVCHAVRDPETLH